MKRRDFIKGLSAACLGTALVRDSLELEPSNAQVTKPVEQHYLGRGMRVDRLSIDEFACIPRMGFGVLDNRRIIAGSF